MTIAISPLPSGGGVRPIRMLGNEDLKIRLVQVTLDSAYTSGGYSLPPSSVDLNEIYYVFTTITPCGDVGGDGLSAIGVGYDYTNKKLTAYYLNTGKEVTNAGSLQYYKTRLLVVGN